MKKRVILALCLAVIYVFVVCGLSFCDSYPQRIVSLGPSITEQLYSLEGQDRLIGCTIYCNRPKEAASKEKIGTVIEINLEKIVSLKPDLVIATALTNSKAIKKLRGLGLKVITFASPENFAGLCNQYIELARIIGKQEQAEKLIDQVNDRVSAIRKKVGNLPKLKVFVQVGAKPLVTITERSFINDFIEFAGCINVALGATTGLYSREEVLKKNPDIILIVTMGIAGEKEKEIWERYDIIKAVQNNKIYIIDSDKVCSPSPLSFVQTLDELVDILHFKSIQAKEK